MIVMVIRLIYLFFCLLLNNLAKVAISVKSLFEVNLFYILLRRVDGIPNSSYHQDIDETCSFKNINSIEINFTWCINRLLLLNIFSFLFLPTFLLINLISLVLTLESSVTFLFVSESLTVSCSSSDIVNVGYMSK